MSPKRTSSVKKQQPTIYGSGGVSYQFPNEGVADAIQINVDFSLVAPPASYYYADAIHAKVDEALSMVILSFGRRDAESDNFADRIDIVMPAASVFQSFWASSREVEATVDKIIARLYPVMRVPEVNEGKNLAQTLFANMIFMAIGDGEASLDFYHLPPREVHLAKTKKADMQLQPIVRVILPIILVKHFFNILRSYAGKVQPSGTTEGRQHAIARR